MGSRLSICVPPVTPRQYPFMPYYSLLDAWRQRSPDRLRQSVLVAGVPRSGTTWLGDIVSDLAGWPLLHEPTHLLKLSQMMQEHGWTARAFREPGTVDADLAIDVERIVTGTYLGPGMISRSPRLEAHLWRRSPLVTKVIDLNLLLPWMAGSLGWMRVVRIVRHPFEVAASQAARTESVWSKQDTLPLHYQAFFAKHPEYEAPGKYQTVIECLVTMWAIEHAWLRDNEKHLAKTLLVRYEDLRTNLEGEVKRLVAYLGTDGSMPSDLTKLARPSRSVNPVASTLAGGADAGWRSSFEPSLVVRLRAILERYGYPAYGPETTH